MAKLEKIFSGIYDQYINKIYRFIFLKVNSKDLAEDLTSETFLRGWEAFKRNNEIESDSEGGIENIQAFLYQIARNLVIDYYRSKAKAQLVSVEYVSIIDPKQDLEEKTLLSSDVDQVRLALNDLKDDYQNVIIWHYLDDLPIKDVAKIMGRTEETTRVLLHRALTALKKRVNNN